jgi:hypothetical protein
MNNIIGKNKYGVSCEIFNDALKRFECLLDFYGIVEYNASNKLNHRSLIDGELMLELRSIFYCSMHSFNSR